MTSLEDAVLNLDGLDDIAELFDDDEITNALAKVIKIIKNPDINGAVAAKLVNQFTALAVKAKLEAKIYMHLNKSAEQARVKKDFLFTIHECFMDLANALKYSTK